MNTILKKLFLVTCFLFTFSESYSQDSKHDTYTNDGFSFAARGKIFGFFVFEDLYFATYTLGGELIYNNKHSLGIDGTFFRWRRQTDNSEDTHEMYDQLERRLYLLIDYKYTFVSFENLDLYLNVYDKTGTYKMWYKDYNHDYGKMDKTFLNSTATGTFNEPGIGIGLKSYLYESPLGIDISANAAYRFTNNDQRIYISETETDFKINKNETWRFYMRLNLFYNFNK